MNKHTMTRAARRNDRRPVPGGEGGYVLALAALLIVPLLLFAGFATDIGSWYATSTSTQRSADAAALAGVIWMPDLDKATDVARESAARNGFEHGVDGVTVAVAQGGTDRQLEVEITGPADLFFSSMMFDDSASRAQCGSDLCITRRAVSEFVLGVPLGSPEPTFGNVPKPTGTTCAINVVCNAMYTQPNVNVWASISGPYTNRVDGDPFSTKCQNSSSHTSCSSTNPAYRDTGYLYAIELPADASGRTLTVDVFDGPHNARPSYPNVETADNGRVNTMFELFEADETQFDNSDNPSLNGQCSSGPGRVIYEWDEDDAIAPPNRWIRLCGHTVTVPDPATKIYLLRVKSSAIPGLSDHGNGWNQFALRSALSGSGAQPRLYALNDMSMFNNPPLVSGSNTATFFLADVGEVHAGKVFAVSLFDPGDSGLSGNMDLNFLSPGSNTNVTCRTRSRTPSGTTTAWVTRNPCSVVTKNGSANPFQGNWLDVEMNLPTNYTCASGGTDCWWKVRYDFSIRPNDRTVWSAEIRGDPVHLEE